MITNIKSGLLKIAAFLFIVVVVTIASQFTQVITGQYFVKKEIEEAKKLADETKDINDRLFRLASEINESLPFTVNSEINLVSTISGNKTFRYNYKLVNYSFSEVHPDTITGTKQQTINMFCSEQDTKEFRDNDVTVEYAYHGNDGKQITVIPIAPSDCRNN